MRLATRAHGNAEAYAARRNDNCTGRIVRTRTT